MDSSWVPVVVAIVTVLGSIAGNLIANHKTKKERLVSDALKEQELNNRLDRIEEKLDQHNGYADKFASISEEMIAQGKDIEYIKHILLGKTDK